MKEIIENLKDIVLNLEHLQEMAKTMSGEQAAEAYINAHYRKRDLFSWQRDSLKDAFMAGFMVALDQERSGKFKELED